VTTIRKTIYRIIGGILAAIVILLWWGAQPSKRSRNMPADSVWIAAPNLPFSWHHGWWFGCWIDSDGYSNRCRLWAEGLDVVYEGQYVSCDSNSPVPARELKIRAPADSMHMWVATNSNHEGDIALAAFLGNGKFLVPVSSPDGCKRIKGQIAQ
jgi:hypothetical protein